MKNTLKTLLILFPILLSCSQAEIYSLKESKVIKFQELSEQIPNKSIVVLGEYHYDDTIQSHQKEIMQELINRKLIPNDFELAWEFFEYDYQKEISESFDLYKNSIINEDEFLKDAFPKAKDPLQNKGYMKSINVAKDFDAPLIATNATRKTKEKLMKKGIRHLRNLPAKDRPDLYLQGTKNYFDRFKEAMGGHGTPDDLRKYFLAQTYTDSIMAHKIFESSQRDLTFMIVGAFHSDYNDGLIKNLTTINQKPVVTIKVLNKSKLTSDELEKLKQDHPVYGKIADYIVY